MTYHFQKVSSPYTTNVIGRLVHAGLRWTQPRKPPLIAPTIHLRTYCIGLYAWGWYLYHPTISLQTVDRGMRGHNLESHSILYLSIYHIHNASYTSGWYLYHPTISLQTVDRCMRGHNLESHSILYLSIYHVHNASYTSGWYLYHPTISLQTVDRCMQGLCGHIQAPTMRLKVDNGAPGGGRRVLYISNTSLPYILLLYKLCTAKGEGGGQKVRFPVAVYQLYTLYGRLQKFSLNCMSRMYQ